MFVYNEAISLPLSRTPFLVVLSLQGCNTTQLQHIQIHQTGSHKLFETEIKNRTVRNAAFPTRGVLTGDIFIEIKPYVTHF